MPAKILQFISRIDQVRQRGMDNYSHWKRITKGLEVFGPAERSRLFRQQAEDEAKDRGWAMRHAPGPGQAVLIPFGDVTRLPQTDSS